MDGRISTFIFLCHVCILSLDPVSAVDIFDEWAHTVSKVIDLKVYARNTVTLKDVEKPCQGYGKKVTVGIGDKRNEIPLPQPRHCGCMFPAVCSLLVCMWVIATGGEGVLVIFVGRRLELSVHCEVAAVVSQTHVNLSTGRDLRGDAPLSVFNHTAPLYDVIFHSP